MRLPDPPSLTPEERELAQRLAQAGPPREPSPALDARILLAARAAAGSTPVRQLSRRWPVALGLAASLVLAVGVAWRLRPLPETRAGYPAASANQTRPGAVPSPVEPMSEVQSSAAADAGTTDTAPVVETPAPEPVSQKPARDEMRKVTEEPPAEPAIVFDLPAQSTAARMAPRSAASAPPVDDAAPQAFGSSASVRRATTASPSPASASDAMQAQSATNEAARAAMVGAAAGTDSASNDEPADDVPPATADSPAVRDAWLQRIRGLVDSGDVAAARASLREFVRRYPASPLPEDLRALDR